ncbi:MAG: DUF4276 family protein [Telluria sp.]
MTTIVSIVEGHGEVAALPVLLRRIGQWLSPGVPINVLCPIRVRRDQFLNRDEIFSKQMQLAALKCGESGWILILLDADDDCPAELAPRILERAVTIVPRCKVSVVLATREYEAWFIASAASLSGRRGFSMSQAPAANADTIRGAKEWLSRQIPGGRYSEVTDQPAFSATMDLQLASDHSRSFRKLCSEWMKNVLSLGASV